MNTIFFLENLKRPLGRLMRRWKYNIKMDLRHIVLEAVE
jgi:hypothetical protein